MCERCRLLMSVVQCVSDADSSKRPMCSKCWNSQSWDYGRIVKWCCRTLANVHACDAIQCAQVPPRLRFAQLFTVKPCKRPLLLKTNYFYIIILIVFDHSLTRIPRLSNEFVQFHGWSHRTGSTVLINYCCYMYQNATLTSHARHEDQNAVCTRLTSTCIGKFGYFKTNESVWNIHVHVHSRALFTFKPSFFFGFFFFFLAPGSLEALRGSISSESSRLSSDSVLWLAAAVCLYNTALSLAELVGVASTPVWRLSNDEAASFGFRCEDDCWLDVWCRAEFSLVGLKDSGFLLVGWAFGDCC